MLAMFQGRNQISTKKWIKIVNNLILDSIGGKVLDPKSADFRLCMKCFSTYAS